MGLFLFQTLEKLIVIQETFKIVHHNTSFYEYEKKA